MKRQQNFPLNLIHRSLPIPIFLNLKIDDRPPPFSPILNAGPRSTYRISSSDSNIHPLHVQTSSIFRFAVCKTVNGHICLLLRCRANGCKLHKRSAASVAVAWITSGTNLKIRMVAPWVEFQIQLLADSHDPVTSHLTLQGVICVPEVAWPFHLRKIQVFEFGRRDFSHDEGIATVALHYALDLIVAAISLPLFRYRGTRGPIMRFFRRPQGFLAHMCSILDVYVRCREHTYCEEWVGIEWRDAESE